MSGEVNCSTDPKIYLKLLGMNSLFWQPLHRHSDPQVSFSRKQGQYFFWQPDLLQVQKTFLALTGTASFLISLDPSI